MIDATKDTNLRQQVHGEPEDPGHPVIHSCSSSLGITIFLIGILVRWNMLSLCHACSSSLLSMYRISPISFGCISPLEPTR